MSNSSQSSSKNRLHGIDLCRGIAAYAVILVHSGDPSWSIPVDSSAVHFSSFFHFSVPFFLATSSFLSTQRINDTYPGLTKKFWLSKLSRIGLPYLIWSLIYLILRVGFYSLESEASLNNFLSEPSNIIFFGASSYHLYFLPLLMIGFLNFPFLYYFNLHRGTLKQKIVRCTVLFSLSVLLQAALGFRNSFNLGNYIAFKPLLDLLPIQYTNGLRIPLVLVYFFLWNLPYSTLSIILNTFLKSMPGLGTWNRFRFFFATSYFLSMFNL